MSSNPSPNQLVYVARLTIRSNGERKANSSFLPLSRKFENTKAINSRFCSVFERSKMPAAREATEIKLSSVVRNTPSPF